MLVIILKLRLVTVNKNNLLDIRPIYFIFLHQKMIRVIILLILYYMIRIIHN